MSLPTQDAQEALRFDVYPEGRGQAVRVSQVAAGSEAEAAGVQVGQKLRAISDPVRQGEMWTLGDAPSVRFVRDALRLRRSGVVELVLEELAPGEAEAAAAAAAADAAEQLRAAAARAEMDPATAATSSTLDALMGTPGAAGNASVDGTAAGSGGGMTIAEKMMLQQQAAERAKGTVGDVRRRIERRQAYLDEMNKVRPRAIAFSASHVFRTGLSHAAPVARG